MKTILKTFTTINLLFIFCWLSGVEAKAQNIGMNPTGANPHSSALVDIDATGGPALGLLIPRIALTAINVAAPVTSPATSLLVYNTASASTGTNAVSSGYYYWDGAKWVRFAYNQSGNSANDWSTLGNAATIAGTNFLGTTDNQDLVFKRNGVQAGLISSNGTSFGLSALNPLNTGSGAVAFGISALQNNTTGIYNTAIGFQSLMNNTNGATNTGVGFQSLLSNTAGSNNTAVGVFALTLNSTGNSNTSIGINSLAKNSTGSYNVGSGFQALFNNTTGSDNTGIGSSALQANTVGSYNTAIGSQALGANTTGTANMASGYQALSSNTTGSHNTASGFQSLTYNTTGNNNTAVGSQALSSNTTGSTNVAVGNIALFNNTTGTENTAVGMQALYNNNNGASNTAIGFIALSGNSSGTNNTAVGRGALLQNSTGNANNAFGSGSLYSNTIGTQNSVFGNAAMSTNISGSYNIAMGQQALSLQTNGSYNSAIGYESLFNNLSNYNTGLGYLSGYTNTSGQNNTFVGAFSDATAGTFTNATAIGYNAKVGQSNALILGGTGADAVNVGVGTSTPRSRAQIEGPNAELQISNNALNTGTLAVYFAHQQSAYGAPGYTKGSTAIFSKAAGSWAQSHMYFALRNANDGADVSIADAKMTILNSGNIGIGTTTPTEKLEVQGSVKIVDGTQGNGKVLTSDATGKASWLSAGSKFFQSLVGANTTSTVSGVISSSYVYVNNSIVIPEAGTFLLFTTAHITNNDPVNDSWFNVNYSTSNSTFAAYPTTPGSCADLVGKSGSGSYTRNFTNINVITISAPTTLYQWIRSTSSTNWTSSGNYVDGESTIIAIKLN